MSQVPGFAEVMAFYRQVHFIVNFSFIFLKLWLFCFFRFSIFFLRSQEYPICIMLDGMLDVMTGF